MLQIRNFLCSITVRDGTVLQIKDEPRIVLPQMEAALQGHGLIVLAR